MEIAFVPLPTGEVTRIRATMRDAYGEPVEVHTAGDDAYPCRHCLGQTPPGDEYLILAHRPFQTRNPYAETGPIFLCAADCTAPSPSADRPAILRSPRYLVRGYDEAERIVYGSGEVVETARISDHARKLFADSRIVFVDVRSASNNCFHCRIVRRGPDQPPAP